MLLRLSDEFQCGLWMAASSADEHLLPLIKY
jgi:hypothetical protein